MENQNNGFVILIAIIGIILLLCVIAYDIPERTVSSPTDGTQIEDLIGTPVR